MSRTFSRTTNLLLSMEGRPGRETWAVLRLSDYHPIMTCDDRRTCLKFMRLMEREGYDPLPGAGNANSGPVDAGEPDRSGAEIASSERTTPRRAREQSPGIAPPAVDTIL